MNLIEKIQPNFIQHEGFYYLEFQGEFFKGCKRCGGEGHYSHNGEHSRCYDCDNTSAKLGEQLESEAAAQKWCHERAVRRAQRERKAEEKRMKAVHAMGANQQALKAKAPDVYEFLMAAVIEEDQEWESRNNLEKNGFIRAMAETLRWVAPSKPFTPNMIAAIRRTMESKAAQAADAAAHPVIPGRQELTGEILSAKLVEGDYGTAYKIVLKDDRGFRVYVSLPKAQADDARGEFFETVQNDGYSIYDFGPACWLLGTDDGKYTGVKGKRIAFTATVEASHDDQSFGFGSQPTKGAWL